MKSKSVVFACLLFVSVVVIASALSKGNQEQPDKVEVGKANPVEDSKQHCHHGCCHFIGHRCVKCCGSVAEAQAKANNNNAQEDHELEAWRGGGHHGGWRGGGGHGRGGGGK